MKITMESTEEVVCINGVPSRLWRGVTGEGARCDCFVSLIRVDPNVEDTRAFDRELQEMQVTQDQEPVDMRLLV
jgi:hypothetical protein